MSRPEMSHCVKLVSTRMRVLRFFPRSKASRAAMAELIHEATSSNLHADVLVRNLLTSFDNWPGPLTVRKVAAQCRPIGGVQPLTSVDRCQWCEGSGLTLDAQPCPLEEHSVSAVGVLLHAGVKFCNTCQTGARWRQMFEGEFHARNGN